MVLVFGAWSLLAAPRARVIIADAKSIELDTAPAFGFSFPVNRKKLAPSIEPAIEGEWVYEEPIFGIHLFRILRFVPDHAFQPETTYRIKLAGITSEPGWGKSREYEVDLTTKPLPDVASVKPAAAATFVSPTDPLEVELTDEINEASDFEFSLEPAFPIVATLQDNRKGFTLTHDQPLTQGTTYTLNARRTFVATDRDSNEVVIRGETELVYQGTFSVAPPPSVVSVTPTGGTVSRESEITVTFSEPMNTESVTKNFSVQPAIAGEVKVSADKKVVTLKPTESLPPATTYAVQVAASTETEQGGFLPTPVTYSFTSIGPVRVVSFLPKGGVTGVNIGNRLHVNFDQEVDHASAQSAFSVTPALEGSFYWTGNTMSFRPKNPLRYDTRYTMKVASGVKSILGLPSAAVVSSSFTTASQTVRLSVPMDYQDKPLSCEAAALKMALAAKGVTVSETAIMNIVGYDKTPHKGSTWGDPYTAFVGDINGKQNTTGYGVYWGPIAKAAKTWRDAEAFTGWTVAQLTAEIAKGNPVVVWGSYAGGYEDSWKTPAGKTIFAWKGEHARTVVGFIGPASNPSKILIHDPVAGRLTWTKKQFEQDWNIFGRAGVVVR